MHDVILAMRAKDSAAAKPLVQEDHEIAFFGLGSLGRRDLADVGPRRFGRRRRRFRSAAVHEAGVAGIAPGLQSQQQHPGTEPPVRGQPYFSQLMASSLS